MINCSILAKNPWFYALHRAIETVLGIGMAILVSLCPS